MTRCRIAFRSLAPTVVALLASTVLASAALAGDPTANIDFPGCDDPTKAGKKVFDEFEFNIGLESCPKACKDGAKSCVGVGKANLSCLVKGVKPLLKSLERNCMDDPETEDACLADLDAQAGELGALLKIEKAGIKDNCLEIFEDCFVDCFGAF